MMHDHLPTPDAIPVASLGLDDFETGLLAVMRHFLTAFARPESQAWQSAYAGAAERWGAARGPQVAHGLLAVIQTVRQVRREDFHYANPMCQSCREQATAEEAAFCLMIHAMRRDRADLARGAVLDLTGGRMDPMLIQVALAFAARFPAAAGASSASVPDAAPAPARVSPAIRIDRPAGRHLRLVH